MSNSISTEKKLELEAELKERKEITRVDILQRLQYAKSLGDLSENAEYHAAREDQGKNEDRIKEIEHTLKFVPVIDSTEKHDVGALGAVMTIKRADSETTKDYTLVGHPEADITKGKISVESPIGKALLGKRVGDIAEVITPSKTVTYTVTAVS